MVVSYQGTREAAMSNMKLWTAISKVLFGRPLHFPLDAETGNLV